MRLTSYSFYSIRVLMVAAARSPALATVAELARGIGAPETHIVKCVHNLGRWGYLQTVRGRGGGFRLAKPAPDISVGEILRKTEEGFALIECLNPSPYPCPFAGRCTLCLAFSRATRAFLAALDAVSLEDLGAEGAELLAQIALRDERAAATVT